MSPQDGRVFRACVILEEWALVIPPVLRPQHHDWINVVGIFSPQRTRRDTEKIILRFSSVSLRVLCGEGF